MRIDKVKWITARSCGKQKLHSFASSLGWKGKIWNSTLSDKMCPRKQTTEPKLLILVSFFSGEVTPYTDTSYSIHILWEVCRSVIYGPPCIDEMPFWFSTDDMTLCNVTCVQKVVWNNTDMQPNRWPLLHLCNVGNLWDNKLFFVGSDTWPL